MARSCWCDAAEGPLPQTKFVLTKALARGIRPIVVINKVDRQDARPDEVHDEVFDLFAALGATDEQLDFPTMFASGRQGWADMELEGARKDLSPMFDLILQHVPPPKVELDKPFAMNAAILEADNFLGRILTGRVEQGIGRLNMPVKVLRQDGTVVETGRLTKLMTFSRPRPRGGRRSARRATSSPSPACPTRPSRTPSAARK